MPFFGQEIFEQAQAKGPLTDAAYLKARDDAAAAGRPRRAAGDARRPEARRADRAGDGADLAHRPRARRSLRRRRLRHGRGGRHAEPHRADGRDAAGCRSAWRSWAAPTATPTCSPAATPSSSGPRRARRRPTSRRSTDLLPPSSQDLHPSISASGRRQRQAIGRPIVGARRAKLSRTASTSSHVPSGARRDGTPVHCLLAAGRLVYRSVQ